MASTWSQLVMVVRVLIWMSCSLSSSLALPATSQLSLPTSTISAAPALLPALSPTLSPDVTPLFPSPAGAGAAPSPSESSLPTIPSSPSPPNPDQMLAPGPTMSILPSDSLPDPGSLSNPSSIAPGLSRSINSVMFLGLMAFWLMQFYGM